MGYQRVADDECFIGQPFGGAAWANWARNSQSFAGGRGRIVASAYCYQPVFLGAPNNFLEVVTCAQPWERLYRVRIQLGMRSSAFGIRNWAYSLTVTSNDLVGASPSAAQPALVIHPPLESESPDASWHERDIPGTTRLAWPVLPRAAGSPSLPPDLVRVPSGVLTHEILAGLQAIPDRAIRLTVANTAAGPNDPEVYLCAYSIVGYDDAEIV